MDEDSKIDDETGAAVDAVEVDQPEASGTGRKLTKAEKLEAKAARLREADEKTRAEREVARSGALSARGVSRGWIVVAAILGALVIGLGALSAALYVKYDRAHKSQKLDALRNSALIAAQDDAVAFSSFDYQNMPANEAKVVALLTPSFAKDYTSVTASLRSLIAQEKGKSVATVRGAAVSNVSASEATVLLMLDQAITTAKSPTPRIDRNRVQLTMQRQKNGTWLVSKIVLL